MTLTAAQQQEVERTIDRLRTSTGTWISDARAAEVISQFVVDRDDAAAKRQFTPEQQEAFETLDREIMACPVAGIARRYHIELPVETALTLRSLIDNFRP